MTDLKKLLEQRNKKKKIKPKFIRQDAHKKKKIKRKWIRPKGHHSKMRNKFKGYRKSPSSGYRSGRLVSGLNKHGLKLVLINNLNDLAKINDSNNDNKNYETGIIIASSVGIKKKIEILKKCKELKLKVINVKDVDNFINTVEAKIKKKKKEREEKKKKKETKKKEREKLAKEKKDKETKEEKRKTTEGEGDLTEKIIKEEAQEQEKKKKEKQEMDKVLTKRK